MSGVRRKGTGARSDVRSRSTDIDGSTERHGQEKQINHGTGPTDMAQGLFITLEGIDGSGKTTLAKNLYDAMKGRGDKVVRTYEPSNGLIGRFLNENLDRTTNPIAELFLFLADRAAHSDELWALKEKGNIIVCDRYSDSTVVYQGATLENTLDTDPVDWLFELQTHFALKPDVTFLIDITPKLALERAGKRGELSKFEQLQFLEKVDSNYSRLLAKDDRFKVLDGQRSQEQLLEDALTHLDSIRKE